MNDKIKKSQFNYAIFRDDFKTPIALFCNKDVAESCKEEIAYGDKNNDYRVYQVKEPIVWEIEEEVVTTVKVKITTKKEEF